MRLNYEKIIDIVGSAKAFSSATSARLCKKLEDERIVQKVISSNLNCFNEKKKLFMFDEHDYNDGYSVTLINTRQFLISNHIYYKLYETFVNYSTVMLK